MCRPEASTSFSYVLERQDRQGGHIRRVSLGHGEIQIPDGSGLSSHPDGADDESHDSGEGQQAGRPALRGGLRDDRLDLSRIGGFSLPDTLGRELERPRQYERDGKSQEEQGNDQSHETVREGQRTGQRICDLQDAEGHGAVDRHDLKDLPTLEFGEQTLVSGWVL
jgi:hypothetical protein